ncbi:MAG: hypothetical protein ACO1NZ_16150, partial [Adhaeribacter sp.]
MKINFYGAIVFSLLLTCCQALRPAAVKAGKQDGLIICAQGKNDLTTILEANNYSYQLLADPAQAVDKARKGGA